MNKSYVYDARGNGDGETVCTLTGDHQNRITDYTAICIQGNAIDRSEKSGCCGKGWTEDVSYTLNTAARHAVMCAEPTLCMAHGQAHAEIFEDVCPTLSCNHEQPIICDNEISGVDCRNFNETGEVYPTLQAKSNGGQSLNYSGALRVGYKVRRLTPVECERLQGYPDHYTDIGQWIDDKGKLHKEASDTARYKALGNSIALPQWKWLLERMKPYLPEEPTMASLFDGLGGFPFCWNAVFGEGLVEWASEVEPFCIAVTNKRINGIDPDARLQGE